jgi:quercetin dioxygenase-like cupin family protein
MKHAHLGEMIKGWFVGDFEPTVINSPHVEVAVKKYKAGEKESKHFHKVATEITVVISGKVVMLGQTWSEGDIIVLSPGEETAFEALTDAVNVVVKLPAAKNDKYIVGE